MFESGGDSIEEWEEFLKETGIGPEVEPEPLREPSVPTTPVSGRQVWTPFSEGPLISGSELCREFYRELFHYGPYSLTRFLRSEVEVPFSGVYCLFYVGREWDLYASIRSEASTLATYAGQAVNLNIGQRLHEHAMSIQQQGLGLENFTCRFIALPDWFDGEQTFLGDFDPLWNKYLTGFGVHQQRINKRGGFAKPSDWDLVHRDLTKQKRKGAPVSADRPVEPILRKLRAGMRKSLATYHRWVSLYGEVLDI